MSNLNSNLPQWEKRVQIVKFLYSFLIKKNSISETKKEAFEYNFDANQLRVIEYCLNNFQAIHLILDSQVNSKWQFDRLNYVDQAILLEAYSEYQVSKTDKAILIDQSIITAKKYSDDSSFKYINAILEKVL